MTFQFLYLSYQYISFILSSYGILDVGLPETQCWYGIWHWWITVYFSTTMLSILHMSSMLFGASGIDSDNETGTYDVLGESLDICGITIYSLD